MHFFFFGTLLDEEVLALVLGRQVPPGSRRPACLDGYRRVKADGVTYPIVVPHPGSSVAGVLVSGLSAADAAKLKAYEGRNYDMVELEVLAAGRRRPARVFVPIAAGGLTALDADWTLEEWRARHRTAFLARIRRRKSAEEAS